MDIQKQIQNLLDEIEREQKVKIILAIESGSRAWGFPSRDSDYDIRFIYHHDRDWYLSAFQKRDVVDTVFIGDLDAGGWDITKCMQLMHKGNAPLLEWLHSPAIYRQDETKVAALRELAKTSFNPKMIFHHYLSLAKKKILDEKTAANAKSYLYALRALLCAQWVVDFKSIPPVDFEVLQGHYFKRGTCLDQLAELLSAKLNLGEGDQYMIPDELMAYAKDSLKRLAEADVQASRVVGTEIYDNFLKKIVKDERC
jgi:uncharacterized protein